MSGFEDDPGSEAVSPPLSDPIRQRVEAEYPPAVRSSVEQALRRYGGKSHHRDVEWMRLAILELSGGRLDDVEHYVSEADGDWRDIGHWLAKYHRPFQELLDRLVKRRKLAAEERLSIDRMRGGEYRKLLHLLELMRARAIRPTKAELQLIVLLGAQMRLPARTWEGLR